MVVLGHVLCDLWIATYLHASWYGLCCYTVTDGTLKEGPEPSHTAASRREEQAGTWLPISAHNHQQFSQRPDMPITSRQIQQDQQGLFYELA